MIACEGDKPKVKTATPQSTDTSKTDTERQRTKQPIDARVRALPAMSSPSDGEPTIRARRLTDRALELHRSRRYDDALATYAQAIATDPSNTLARYNLAALLVSMKKPESALHVLGVLRDFACTSCLQRVRDARTDEEWKPLWSDERFMRLTNVSGGGPTADVLAFYLAPNHVNVGKSHFEAVILIDPPPGFASAPKLELTFAENGTPAETVVIEAGAFVDSVARTSFPKPKNDFQVTLTVDGNFKAMLRGRAGEMSKGEFPHPYTRMRGRMTATECEVLECPSFPVLSRDGDLVAAVDDEHMVDPQAFCHSPVGKIMRFYDTAGNYQPSHELTGWQPLSCQPKLAKLRDGRIVATTDGESEVTLVAKSGESSQTLMSLAGRKADLVCVSPSERHAVIKLVTKARSTCEDTPRHAYQVVTIPEPKSAR